MADSSDEAGGEKMVIITMQFRSPDLASDMASDLVPPPPLSHVASLRSQFMETEAFHTLVTEGLYENGSDSGDGYSQATSQPRHQSGQGGHGGHGGQGDNRRVKRRSLQHQADCLPSTLNFFVKLKVSKYIYFFNVDAYIPLK